MSDTRTVTGVRQRLLAIMAADVAGYSRLMSMDEHATVQALDEARKLFRSHIEANQGRVIDTWVWYKTTQEVDALRQRPHPFEFTMYYDA